MEEVKIQGVSTSSFVKFSTYIKQLKGDLKGGRKGRGGMKRGREGRRRRGREEG